MAVHAVREPTQTKVPQLITWTWCERVNTLMGQPQCHNHFTRCRKWNRRPPNNQPTQNISRLWFNYILPSSSHIDIVVSGGRHKPSALKRVFALRIFRHFIRNETARKCPSICLFPHISMYLCVVYRFSLESPSAWRRHIIRIIYKKNRKTLKWPPQSIVATVGGTHTTHIAWDAMNNNPLPIRWTSTVRPWVCRSLVVRQMPTNSIGKSRKTDEKTFRKRD